MSYEVKCVKKFPCFLLQNLKTKESIALYIDQVHESAFELFIKVLKY